MNNELKAAIERRNIDLINGELRLPNGNDVTEENVNVMLYGPYAMSRIEDDAKWLAKAEALADDATIEEVRAATWGDSRSTTKQDLLDIFAWKQRDRDQYEADVLLALRHVQEEEL